MLSPCDIEVLLHYHASPVKHPRHDAPAVADARDRLLREGLIEPAEQYPEVCFSTTARGRKFVEMVCSTPFPEVKYIDPREKA